MIGVETAPASRVAVMTQVALAGSVLSRTGRSLMTGTSRVCMTATVIPAKARTGTMGPERSFGGSGSSPACRICFVRRIRGASGQSRSPGLPPSVCMVNASRARSISVAGRRKDEGSPLLSVVPAAGMPVMRRRDEQAGA
ncbi:hypothetical protein SMICM304S_02807 [Streptomyces microflavus]